MTDAPSRPDPDATVVGIVGIGHHDAPSAVRERFARPLGEFLPALASLTGSNGPEEGVVVTTCNRTELYYARRNERDDPRGWLLRLSGLDGDDPALGFLYDRRGPDAVRHLVRVASGLDSMLLGEGQILGQVKDAYAAAERAGLVGPELHRLFQHAFLHAKRIRHATGLGTHAASLAGLAARLPRRIFPNYGELTAIVIGGGETGTLVARYLREEGIGRLLIASRTPARAQELAERYGGHALPLADLAPHLVMADVLVSATEAGRTLVTAAELRAARLRRRRRPILLVDLSIPRTVEPEAAAVPDIFLYGLEQVASIAEDNQARRLAAARAAEGAVDEAVAEYTLARNRLLAAPIIHELRSEADATRARTLAQAERLLAAGRDPHTVLRYLADTLTARLLHAPTVRLREAGERHDRALLEAAHQLFAASETDSDTDPELEEP
jgi:glutamyl-tRNA reductase